MRINRRRAVATLRGRGGAAARPRQDGASRADWRTVAERGTASLPAPAPEPDGPSRRQRGVTAVALTLGLTLVAQALALLLPRAVPMAEAGAGTAVSVGPPVAAARVPVAAPPARRAAPPASVSIPRIKVRSSLVALGVRADRTIETPTDYAQAGWYRDGSRPGEPGPTVVVGHVDSTDGPAVFFRLRELARGDRVDVRRTDGVVVTYVVTEVRRVAKSRFPTKDVYGATPRSALRLVTCGGSFDSKSRSYRDNVVVFADVLVPPAAGGTS